MEMIVLGIVALVLLFLIKWVFIRPTLPKFEGDFDKCIKVGFTKKEVPKEPMDAIVVGSGLGGLTLAALLAKRGKKVLVLEQHDVAGGCTHSYEEKGFEFDVGLHYVGGGVGDGSGLTDLFDDLCSRKVEWHSQGDIYDVSDFPRHRVEWNKHPKRTKAALLAEFPEEEKAIDAYLKKLVEGNAHFGLKLGLRILPNFLRAILEPIVMFFIGKQVSSTTLEVIQSLTKNKDLQNTFAYLCGDYGLPPSKSSWPVHCATANHFRTQGGYYPVGGAAVIAKAICPTIVRAGGKVLVRAPVMRYIMENNACVGVVVNKKRKTNGEGDVEIRAPMVISAVGALNTARLLPKEAMALWPEPFEALAQPKSIASCSHLQVFMGFSGSQEELQLPLYNAWIYRKDNQSIDDMHNEYYAPRSPDEKRRDIPFMFLGFPSAKDPDYARRFPGKSAGTIVTEAPYEWFEQWNDAKLRHRGTEYEELKQGMCDELMEVVYQKHPQLKGRLEYLEIGTPVTNNHYLGVREGESYGLEHTPARLNSGWLAPRTPIDGLWLTGQDVSSAGVFGALFGGYVTAFAMDKRILLRHLPALARTA